MTTIAFDNFTFDEPYKTKNKLAYFLICSLVLHCIGVAYFYHFNWQGNSTITPSPDKAFHVKFSRAKEQSKNTSEGVTQPELQQGEVESEIAELDKPTSETTKPDVAQPTSEVEFESSSEKPIKLKEKVEQPPASANFESIRQAISNSEIQKTILSNEETHSGPYFEPALNRQLSGHLKEQKRLKKLHQEKQRREHNKFFEFQPAGNVQVIRRQGYCWLVPINNGMEIEFRIPLPLGKCKIEKKLDFSTKQLDIEYKDGKRQF